MEKCRKTAHEKYGKVCFSENYGKSNAAKIGKNKMDITVPLVSEF